MNVLVLDDTTELLRYFKAILKPIPKVSSVYSAINAHEFLQGLYTRTQHLIISDVMMSPISGPDIIRMNKDLIGATPIILTSCVDNLKQVEAELLEDGFNVVASFQKPIKPLDFLEFFGND